MSSGTIHDITQKTAFVKDGVYNVFQQNCCDSEVTELITSCEPLTNNEEFHARLQLYLQEEKADFNRQRQLQRLLLCSLYPMHIQRLLDYEIPEAYMPTPDGLLDIGYIVRRLLMKWNDQQDVLFRMYQYSMPFIKHNRLNFPSLRNVKSHILKHMLLAILLTCLGRHNLHTKLPIWQIQRQILSFFNALSTSTLVK